MIHLLLIRHGVPSRTFLPACGFHHTPPHWWPIMADGKRDGWAGDDDASDWHRVDCPLCLRVVDGIRSGTFRNGTLYACRCDDPHWPQDIATCRRPLRISNECWAALELQRPGPEEYDEERCWELSGGSQAVYGPWPKLPEPDGDIYPRWEAPVFDPTLIYSLAIGTEPAPFKPIQRRTFQLGQWQYPDRTRAAIWLEVTR